MTSTPDPNDIGMSFTCCRSTYCVHVSTEEVDPVVVRTAAEEAHAQDHPECK